MRVIRSVIALIMGAGLLIGVASTPATASELPSEMPRFSFDVTESNRAAAIEIAGPDILRVVTDDAQVNMSKANVSRPSGSDSLIVGVTTSGVGHDEGSYVAAVVNLSNRSVTTTLQTKVTIHSETSATTTTWINGQFHERKDVEVTAESARQAEASVAAANDNVLDCLNAAGVSTVAAIAIISACGGLCAVTLGTGCILCIAGFTAVGGYSVGACLSR